MPVSVIIYVYNGACHVTIRDMYSLAKFSTSLLPFSDLENGGKQQISL